MLNRAKRAIANLGVSYLPARYSLACQFRARHGSWPNFRNPRTFSEKIQARKLYDSDPRFATHADKVLAKEIVAAKLGPEWVTPTLWHGKELPPVSARTWSKPYVMKANHGSGWNIFVRSKTDEDWDAIESTTKQWMSSRYEPLFREPGYSAIVPQLFVEPFIGELDELPTDYKFFVFDGRAEYVTAHIERATALRVAVYDRKWERQPVRYGYPGPNHSPTKPISFDQMLKGAEALGEGFSFVRVDFYEIKGHPLFGEMTFSPGSGLWTFDPIEWDYRFGEFWR